MRGFRRSFKRKLEKNAGALHDLTTEASSVFDDKTADVGSVKYINVAGDASQGSNGLLLLDLAAAIGNITHEVNDGVATKSSALRAGNRHLADWPVDHAGEIGWSKDLLTKPKTTITAHLARYDAIVALL